MMFLFRPVLFALAGLLLFLSGCASGILRPFPPSPTPGPTNTQVAEITPLPHPPTRTLTPIPDTRFVTATNTWTPTSTNLPPSTPTFTATATASIAPTNTASPSPTPTLPTIQPGRSLITPPAMTLPNTGGEPDRTPGTCKYYNLQLGMLGDDIVIYLQCVKDLIGNEVS